MEKLTRRIEANLQKY